MDERLLLKDVIVFDVGNVLVRFDPWHIAHKCFPERTADRLYDAVFKSGLWGIIDTGLMTNGRLARLMCEAAHTDDMEDYFAVARLLDTFYLHERALNASKWLPELKKMGKKLYYLSNYAEPAFVNTMSRHPFFQYFDGGVVSARENVCKPARRIYEILCERYGFSPKDALYIDDTLENVQAAQALGFSVWHYKEGPLEPVDD